MKETEIKFPLEDPRAMRRLLEEKGARHESGFFEDNIVYDDEGGSLFRKKQLLRLRKSDGVYLTFKKPLSSDRFKVMEEHEVTVSDFDAAHLILTSIGFRKVFRYQKRRDVYRFKGTELLIDHTPIGDFLEVEGEEIRIGEVCRVLGLSLADGTTKNYLQLYRDHCRDKDSPPQDMLF